MAIINSRILSTSVESFEIECPIGLHFEVGQYFLASSSEALEPASSVLFPIAKDERKLKIGLPFPDHWQVGMPLMIRGPLGKGFTLPIGARRIALVHSGTLDQYGSVFAPLIESGLKAGGEVVFYGDILPSHLPTAVEVLPVDQISDAWKWAEYLAAEIEQSQLNWLLQLLWQKTGSRLPDRAEVLIHTPLICGGLAECGLCSVKTKKGNRLACKDGPVFQLEDLEYPESIRPMRNRR
jgi:hypothetical protein